ncbi:similar to 1190005I06Rik protein (predicted) [Rattus norvegicus]|uniref:Similar to 1190005I06Rik protein (Predicted) n=1 Tax=Rattus norvegicus TaxID=10116 RepID=A6IZM6_RAT|nr:similar to 1190005I06Rik protein (predicted) [Rattus norvegicus]
MTRRAQQVADPSGADICGLHVHTNPDPGLVKRRPIPLYGQVTVTMDLGPQGHRAQGLLARAGLLFFTSCFTGMEPTS